MSRIGLCCVLWETELVFISLLSSYPWAVGTHREEMVASHTHCSNFWLCHQERDLFFTYGFNWEPFLAACSLPNKVYGSRVDFSNLSPMSCRWKNGPEPKVTYWRFFPSYGRVGILRQKVSWVGFAVQHKLWVLEDGEQRWCGIKGRKNQWLEPVTQSALNWWEIPSWTGHQCQDLTEGHKELSAFLLWYLLCTKSLDTVLSFLGSPSSIPRPF